MHTPLTADSNRSSLDDLSAASSYQRSLDLLRKSVTPAGILASVTPRANYARVWARDSVICGIAGLIARDDTIIEGLQSSLLTLAAHQGPHGQIPSNVEPASGTPGSPTAAHVSYGGLAGRVDTGPWFVIGLCLHARFTKDTSVACELYPAAASALALLDVWEFNTKGLVYCPLASDWADEYVLHGYVLLVQLLRLWALELFAQTYDDHAVNQKAKNLREILEINYWPSQRSVLMSKVYHRAALDRALQTYGERPFWLSSFNPAGYSSQYDFLSNAIAVILKLGTESQSDATLDYGESIRKNRSLPLCPAFWPPIEPGEAGWSLLQDNFIDHFRNYPNQYHNGGLWPMVSGWWAAALSQQDRSAAAGEVADACARHNSSSLSKSELDSASNGDLQTQGDYAECADAVTGQPLGAKLCSWSAAGEIIATESSRGAISFL